MRSGLFRLSGKILFGLIVAGILLFLGGEAAVRFSGLANFPLYREDPEIGYLLAPNQQGVFLNKNHWIYNDKSQGAGPWKPDGRKNLLLLGDSIVLGGNLIDESQRLGPRLKKLLPGWQIWPASAGGWGVPNEIGYLNRFPEVPAAAELIVWVLDTNDFDAKSIWTSETTHPRSHPASALWYAVSKYLVSPYLVPSSSEQAAFPELRIQPEIVAAFVGKLNKLRSDKPRQKIVFVLYPEKAEIGSPAAKEKSRYEEFRAVLLTAAAVEGDGIIEVRDDARWSAQLYRDPVHPTAEGYEILAKIVAENLSAHALRSSN